MSASVQELLDPVERRELRDGAARFARERLAPSSAALDRGEPGALEECWAGVRELGLERALLSAGSGGAGLGPEDLLGPLEELAWGDAGIAMAVLLSNAALLALPGTYATAAPEDERWAAVVVPAPPAAGAEDLRVGLEADGASLDGRVRSALAAAGADSLVILTAGARGQALVVPSATAGCAIHPTADQMGLRSPAAAELAFAQVAAQVAGPAGPARAAVLWGVAAIARGIARRAYGIALPYAEARHQGGTPIVEHGAVRSLLSGMAARLHCTGGAPGELGAAGRNGGAERAPGPREATGQGQEGALAAKIRATDDAVAIATDAVQVLGGTGYTREAGVEKLMRDARYCQLYPEPNWVARDGLLELERSATMPAGWS